MAAGVKSRPEKFSGKAYVIKTHFGKMTIDIHEFPDGRPFETIASVGAVGSDLMADAAAIGMAVSFALRLEDSLIEPSVRLGYFVSKFRPMNGGGAYEAGGEKITSLPSAIAFGIKKYLSGHPLEAADTPLPPRPDAADVRMFVVPTHFGNLTLDVHIKDGEPFEIIVNVGAAGSDLMADAMAIGIGLSICLRLPASMPAKERIQWFIDRFVKIGGNGSYGNGNGKVTSLPSAVARGLQRFMVKFYGDPLPAPESYHEVSSIKQGDVPPGKVMSSEPCPECGAHGSMYMAEGCATCQNCGYSKCS